MTATPGDRPGIPLDAEPITFFHALLAGAAIPVTGGDEGEPPLLEEEPALWPVADRT
ncbi:MAG: hypothetical protein ACRDYV_11700 [Acidimicrobiia bacterium]